MAIPPNPAKSIFLNALELASDAERRAYLDAQCGQDTALRREVEELLEHQRQLGDFLESPAADLGATADFPAVLEQPGQSIGRYQLLEAIGEGGFAVVYLAEQQEPVRRRVALKVLKPGMDTREVIARFESERQALAMMDHPNIARVLDAGATESGRPYFVMELVRGVRLTDYCDQHELDIRQRLELFVEVCQGVQHAHQKGIIHRDLKPSNILVALCDGQPVPKIIDFGIAKAIAGHLGDQTAVTSFGQMIGTPLYMSPEQAGLGDLDVDTRSDIYSLGVVLYELLTGCTPFEHERLREASYEEIRRLIREEEPPRPSARITTLSNTTAYPSGVGRAVEGSGTAQDTPGSFSAATVAARRRTEPAKLSRLLRRQLDWIVMKCLEKDRNRRYETANALARDIQRYLADEPIEARPPTLLDRAARWARRHRAAVRSTGVILALAVVLAVVLGPLIAQREARLRNDAERQAERFERASRLALELVMFQLPRVRDPSGDQQAMYEIRFAEKRCRELVALYEEIEADRANTAENRRQLARTYAVLASLQAARGGAAECRESWRKALEIGAELWPEDSKFFEDLISQYWSSRQRKGTPTGLQEYEHLLRLLRNLAPTSRWARDELFRTYGLARSEAQRAKNFAGVASVDEAIAASLKELQGIGVRGRGEAGTYFNIALRAERSGRFEEAVQAYREALRAAHASLLAYPEYGRDYLHTVIGWNNQAADFFVQRGLFADAGRAYKFVADARGDDYDRSQFSSDSRWAVAVPQSGGPMRYEYPRGLPPRAFAIRFANHYRAAVLMRLAGQSEDPERYLAKAWKILDDFGQTRPADQVELKACASDELVRFARLLRSAKQDAECGRVAQEALKLAQSVMTDSRDQQNAALTLTWLEAAILVLQKLVGADQQAERERLRVEVADRARASPVTRNHAAWELACERTVDPASVALALALAREAVELAPKDDACWNTLGLAEYRAGNWQAAKEAILKSIELARASPDMMKVGRSEVRRLNAGGQGGPFDWLVLAMTEWQLGNQQDARHWYSKARAYGEQLRGHLEVLGAYDDFDRLITEAAQLLGISESPSTAKDDPEKPKPNP